MLDLFLQRNAELLGRVERAIAAGDASALCEAAHAYKGAVNHFAAVGVREIAFALEKAGRNSEMANVEELWGHLQKEVGQLVDELRQEQLRES